MNERLQIVFSGRALKGGLVSIKFIDLFLFTAVIIGFSDTVFMVLPAIAETSLQILERSLIDGSGVVVCGFTDLNIGHLFD